MGSETFHPIVTQWFEERVGTATDIQSQGWPRISNGEHVVITAPTGSGKTLAAFLTAINQFIVGRLEPGATRVLYVSPLKALNNDVERNLNRPLAELRKRFDESGEPFPDIHVSTRSGDTPQAERQRMLRRPPEILITTPESLMLLLTTVRGRHALSTIQLAVVDEVHAIIENRRGVQLMACLERVVDLAGEVQRIALSATVRPPEVVAEYVAGYNVHSSRRTVGVIRSTVKKSYDFKVFLPAGVVNTGAKGTHYWTLMCEAFRERIQPNRSTLFFTNSRRLAEKITLGINTETETVLAYSHHGSLSRDIRMEVERQLKDGQLRAIVATSSLEMGIDIGDLDEVVLVQSPPSVASTLQRIGRAGHQVGEVSRAALYPTHSRDFIDAAVLTQAVAEQDLEPLRPMSNPLDLLAQLIVSMTATETWDVDDLFRTLCRSSPYAELPREHFDLVVEMLAGRFENIRVRNLRPRIAFDRRNGQIRCRKGATFALYSSGGTIPDRGYYRIRHAHTNTVIGELDEEFVWEAKAGKTFTFGTQQWKIDRITHNDVDVVPASPSETAPPFWRSDAYDTSAHFGALVGRFLSEANELLRADNHDELHSNLQNRGFDGAAATELVDYLHRQRETTKTDLPSHDHVVIEHVKTAPGGYRTGEQESQLVIHSTFGGQVNRPIALALEAGWRERFTSEPDCFVDSQSIVIQLKQSHSTASILELLSPDRFDERLRQSLEGSGFFGARFRECAGRSLLLTKRRFDQRMPLWVSRMQAKSLLTATAPQADFPVTLETWRTCLVDAFDVEAARNVLVRIEQGDIRVSVVQTSVPSPFASAVTFEQINRYMYADDTPERRGRSRLADNLIEEAVASADRRPTLKAATIREFESRVQRTALGYAPTDELEQLEWLKERIWIPRDEWFEDQEPPDESEVIRRGTFEWLVHPETVAAGEADLPAQIATALQFYGPRSRSELYALFPVSAEVIGETVDELLEARLVVDDVAVEGSAGRLVCDTQNLESLLRLQRRLQRPEVRPKAMAELPIFVAEHQELTEQSQVDRVPDILDRLRSYTAPVEYWCSSVWSARLVTWTLADVDQHLLQCGAHWYGSGRKRITVAFEGDSPDVDSDEELDERIESAFRDPKAAYTFLQLHDESGMSFSDFNQEFWKSVWGGNLTSDRLTSLQHADQQNYDLDRSASTSRQFRARRLARQRSMGWPGTWRRLQHNSTERDAIAEIEDRKDCCRCLLDRYGVLTREIANREGGVFRWSRLFSALRTMELSGEIVAGLFFEGMSGPQFVQSDAVIAWTRESSHTEPFWVSAWDPVSPCGLGLDWPDLPTRRMGNFLGFAAGELTAICEGYGRRLRFLVEPSDDRIGQLVELLPKSVGRGRLEIESINGESARTSQFAQGLPKSLRVYRDHARLYIEAT